MLIFWKKNPDLSLNDKLIVTPDFQDTMGRQRIREGNWQNRWSVGLENFRGLVGAVIHGPMAHP
jgi:hypothetical protein